MLSQRLHRLVQHSLQLAPTRDQTLPLVDIKNCERGGAACRMAGVGRAVAEYGGPRGAGKKRSGDMGRCEQCAQRLVAGGDALGQVTMSGATGQRSIPSQVPSRPKPQMTQSATNSTPWRAQTSATASM